MFNNNLTESQLKNVLSHDRAALIKVAPTTVNRLGSEPKDLNYEWYEILKAISKCFTNSKKRAKAFGWSNNLSIRYIAELYLDQKGICPITGHILSPYSGDWNQKNPYKMSIDRIDSSQGYIKGNVRLVTHWANNAKNTWEEDVLKEFIVNSYKQLKRSNLI